MPMKNEKWKMTNGKSVVRSYPSLRRDLQVLGRGDLPALLLDAGAKLAGRWPP